jgi:transposase
MTGQSLDSKPAATQGGAVRKRAQRRRPLGRRPDPLSEKHLKAQRHGWAIVEEYQRCCEEDEELARMCGEHDFLLDDADSPASVRRICGTFSKQGINLGKTFVADTLNRWRENGDPTETQSGGDVSERANEDERLWIKRLLRVEPALYFAEVRERYVARFGRSISDKMISQAIHFQGTHEDDAPLTLKTLERLARQRDEVEREAVREILRMIPSECLVIIDETSLDKRSVRRRRGWAPRGQPAHLWEAFRSDGKLRSLMAVMNSQGFVLEACEVVKDGVTDDKFYEWAEEYLLHILNPFDDDHLPNSVLLLDNVGTHHAPDFVAALEETECLVIYNAPYSPDLSAIE